MLGEQHRQVGGELGHGVSFTPAGRPSQALAAFGVAAVDFLELVDLVDLGAHRDVGHLLQDHLDDHRHAVLLRQASACHRGRIFSGSVHAQRLAAQAFHHLAVVDAVALSVRWSGTFWLSKASCTQKSISKPRWLWRIRPR
jgi:hypothetical protein